MPPPPEILCIVKLAGADISKRSTASSQTRRSSGYFNIVAQRVLSWSSRPTPGKSLKVGRGCVLRSAAVLARQFVSLCPLWLVSIIPSYALQAQNLKVIRSNPIPATALRDGVVGSLCRPLARLCNILGTEWKTLGT